MPHKSLTRNAGFTLFEVLIALFIFTILSMLLMSALHQVIDAESRAARKADIFRQLQFAILMMSRDLTQLVDRPIYNGNDKEEPALIGTPTSIIFTHAGFANLNPDERRSSLIRSGYRWKENAIWRLTWEELDQAPNAEPHFRFLLSDVSNVRFSYLTAANQFVDNWPQKKEKTDENALPKGIRVELTLNHFGQLNQFYLIPIAKDKKDEKQTEAP